MQTYENVKAKEPQILELIKKYRETGEIRHRDEIIDIYHPLCVYFAAPYYRAGTGFMIVKSFNIGDFVNEGILGVIKAIDKFDFSFEKPFFYYAITWIKSYLSHFIGQYGGAWKCRAYKYMMLEKVNSVFLAEHGYLPDAEELGGLVDYKDMTKKDIKTFIDLRSSHRALATEDFEMTLDEVPQPHQVDFVKQVDAKIDAQLLLQPIMGTYRNKLYILNKFYDTEYKDLAKAYGSTKGAISVQTMKARREFFDPE
jgi:RNA polymerase sigma factor (sigma-70 family)